jgi:hypothetical protein
VAPWDRPGLIQKWLDAVAQQLGKQPILFRIALGATAQFTGPKANPQLAKAAVSQAGIVAEECVSYLAKKRREIEGG